MARKWSEGEDLLEGVRNQDREAEAQLFERYGGIAKAHAEKCLAGAPHLRPLTSGSDLRNSIFLRLYAGVRKGSIVLSSVGELVCLVRRMVVNRVRDLLRRSKVARERPMARDATGEEWTDRVPDPRPGPSALVARDEEYARFLRALDPEMRDVYRLRKNGMRWGEIADRFGTTENAIRQRWNRARDRALRGIEGPSASS